MVHPAILVFGDDVIVGGAKLIGGIIGKYHAYAIGKRKEDDIAVRKKIASELSKARKKMVNLMGEYYEGKDKKTCIAIQKIIDEIDTFSNDVDLSETGHIYPFFSIQKSINEEQVKKLIEFDRTIIEKVQNVGIATGTIENMLIEKREIDINRELKKIKQYVIDGKNQYKDRRDFIRGLK
ncbi:MAG: hypothetical protein AB1779_01820 [Candidatus Thermoplasmatota archaeon]